MTKQMAKPTRAGQLAGAQLKINTIYNDGLHEAVTLVNRGEVAQPMSGWVLATLRGERLYFFPDDVIAQPGMMMAIHSGQDAPDPSSEAPHCLRLTWTHEQMWDNHGDVVVLFDADGQEIDRYTYPHQRLLGYWVASTQRRNRLVRENGTWYIIDEPSRQSNRKTGQGRLPSEGR